MINVTFFSSQCGYFAICEPHPLSWHTAAPNQREKGQHVLPLWTVKPAICIVLNFKLLLTLTKQCIIHRNRYLPSSTRAHKRLASACLIYGAKVNPSLLPREQPICSDWLWHCWDSNLQSPDNKAEKAFLLYKSGAHNCHFTFGVAMFIFNALASADSAPSIIKIRLQPPKGKNVVISALNSSVVLVHHCVFHCEHTTSELMIFSMYNTFPLAFVPSRFRDDPSAKSSFFQHLVEDRSESAFSYYEFLLHIQQQLSK